jgi:hypothetical protein
VEEPLLKLQQGKIYLNQGLRMSRDELRQYRLDELKEMFNQSGLRISQLRRQREEATDNYPRKRLKQEGIEGNYTYYDAYYRGSSSDEDDRETREQLAQKIPEEEPFTLNDPETLIEELKLPEYTDVDYEEEEEEEVVQLDYDDEHEENEEEVVISDDSEEEVIVYDDSSSNKESEEEEEEVEGDEGIDSTVYITDCCIGDSGCS